MGKRLFCGNLPYAATADDVRALFAENGRTVSDVHIVMDRETGRSRGFAFVEVGSEEEAAAAIREVDGRVFSGRALTVKEAREREPRGGPRPGRPPGGGFRSGPRPPASFPVEDFVPELPPAPPPELEYAPVDDVDYRDRGDRGKRGRDRRGGRRKGEDFGGEGW